MDLPHDPVNDQSSCSKWRRQPGDVAQLCLSDFLLGLFLFWRTRTEPALPLPVNSFIPEPSQWTLKTMNKGLDPEQVSELTPRLPALLSLLAVTTGVDLYATLP